MLSSVLCQATVSWKAVCESVWVGYRGGGVWGSGHCRCHHQKMQCHSYIVAVTTMMKHQWLFYTCNKRSCWRLKKHTLPDTAQSPLREEKESPQINFPTHRTVEEATQVNQVTPQISEMSSPLDRVCTPITTFTCLKPHYIVNVLFNITTIVIQILDNNIGSTPTSLYIAYIVFM